MIIHVQGGDFIVVGMAPTKEAGIGEVINRPGKVAFVLRQGNNEVWITVDRNGAETMLENLRACLDLAKGLTPKIPLSNVRDLGLKGAE